MHSVFIKIYEVLLLFVYDRWYFTESISDFKTAHIFKHSAYYKLLCCICWCSGAVIILVDKKNHLGTNHTATFRKIENGGGNGSVIFSGISMQHLQSKKNKYKEWRT